MNKQWKSHFSKAIIVFSFSSIMPAIILAQDTGGWVIEAPASSVQLTSVGQGMTADLVKFTFTNISGKTIIEFRVDTGHGNMTGLDAFTDGQGAVAPGATTSVVFDTRALSFADTGAKKLYVVAIVYSDGSRAGSAQVVALVENEMLGAALETKRISDLLLTNPDPSIAGFDNVQPRIGSKSPQADNDAAASLKGIALPGVSQTYIDEHLANPSPGLMGGLRRARFAISTEINNVKTADAREMVGTKKEQLHALQNRPHALSDLAQQYSSLSDWQARCIKALDTNSRDNYVNFNFGRFPQQPGAINR